MRNVVRELNLPLSAVAVLLREFGPLHPSLPRDPRTILRTPRRAVVHHKAGGTYMHLSLRKTLLVYLRLSREPVREISIQLNVDGMNISKSSRVHLWPILCRMTPVRTKPFVVGVFCGASKPDNVDEYLQDTVAELRDAALSIEKFTRLDYQSFTHYCCAWLNNEKDKQLKRGRRTADLDAN